MRWAGEYDACRNCRHARIHHEDGRGRCRRHVLAWDDSSATLSIQDECDCEGFEK